MDSITVREAHESDLPGVLALYAQPELDDGEVLSIEQATAVWRRFADYPDYRLLVAESDQQIVGTIALLIMDNIGHLGAPSAIVEDVAVSPDQQGRGIGRRMLEFAMQLAREKGCYKLALTANLKRTGAHAFYESLGFRQHGYSYLMEL